MREPTRLSRASQAKTTSLKYQKLFFFFFWENLKYQKLNVPDCNHHGFFTPLPLVPNLRVIFMYALGVHVLSYSLVFSGIVKGYKRREYYFFVLRKYWRIFFKIFPFIYPQWNPTFPFYLPIKKINIYDIDNEIFKVYICVRTLLTYTLRVYVNKLF